MSTETIAVCGVGVALLAVLVPLILTLHNRLAAEISEVRRDLGDRINRLDARIDRLDTRIDRLDTRLDVVAERVARIEGVVCGPWRPTEPEPTETAQ